MPSDFSPSRTTLDDVARLAGVSSMTVSRVVRGIHLVKATTAKRVQRAIAQSGYHPDPTLCALAAYRSTRTRKSVDSLLAFLDCDQNRYSSVVLSGIQREATGLGYRVQSFPMPKESRERTRLGRILFHRGIRGILIGPSQLPCTLEGWDWNQFAIVSIGALIHAPLMHSVAMDYWQGAIDGAQALHERGCRHIALAIDQSLEQRTGHRWKSGYSIWCDQMRVSPIYLDPQSSSAALVRQVRRHAIDGILTIHSNISEFTRLRSIEVCFLNDVECPAGERCLCLDATHIGAESVRLLHPLLLRREFGLPASPKMMQLRGLISRK